MTKTNMDLSELLAKHDQADVLRCIAEAALQLFMETDVEGPRIIDYRKPACPRSRASASKRS